MSGINTGSILGNWYENTFNYTHYIGFFEEYSVLDYKQRSYSCVRSIVNVAVDILDDYLIVLLDDYEQVIYSINSLSNILDPFQITRLRNKMIKLKETVIHSMFSFLAKLCSIILNTNLQKGIFWSSFLIRLIKMAEFGLDKNYYLSEPSQDVAYWHISCFLRFFHLSYFIDQNESVEDELIAILSIKSEYLRWCIKVVRAKNISAIFEKRLNRCNDIQNLKELLDIIISLTTNDSFESYVLKKYW